MQPLLSMRLDRRGPGVAVGDLDGDGIEDLVISATSGDPARIVRRPATAGNGAAATARVQALDSDTALRVEDGPVLVFDANGDGRADVLQTRSGASVPASSPQYQPVLLLQNAERAFAPAPSGVFPPISMSVGAVAAADFDRDGRLDVFLGARVLPGRYPAAPRSALLANRGRGPATPGFEDVTDAIAPDLREAGMVSSALWTDVDDDGWPDLLLAMEWGGVRFFRNDEGRGFEDRSAATGFASAGSGWWTSLAAADFNRDGRLDYVAGNVGLNTRHHASRDRPAVLYSGSFAGGARIQIVEAHYDGDRLVPWRTRKELGAAIPSVLKRFPWNDAFAKATIGEILGEGNLAAARCFEATELRSGVFLSQPGGSYRFEPLPRIAQIAPFAGVAAVDFDGDGNADILAAQNSYAPDASIGRFNGGIGQLLRGDGSGRFEAVPAAESNIVVRGDARALVVLDLDDDGRPDAVVSRSNDPVIAYRNEGRLGHRSLRIVLRGPAGNPAAIGGRVTLEHADGTAATAEVHAGSGLFSQSSAACFFGYPETNPPRAIRVRWPDGSATTHEPPAGTVLTISSP
jgi:hypothetical protein